MAKKTINQRNEELKSSGKQLRHFGIVLCALPTEKQENLIHQSFGCSRLISNKYLSERQSYFKEKGETLSVAAFKKGTLTPLKKNEDFIFLKNVDKFALEVACENVQDAFDRFFKGQNKFPQFKSKRKAKKAYTTKFTNNNIKLEGKYIQLPKLKKVEIVLPKTNGNQNKFNKVIDGSARILNATISQQGGKYYVSICCEEVVDLVKSVELKDIDLNKIVGIDLGIKDFATINNGLHTSKIHNPKYFSKCEKKLAKLQRKLSKKKLDSNNYMKAKNKVSKLHKKVSNQRLDFAHKESRRLVNENQIVIVENLNIKGMVKNKKLAKSISDAGWSKFLTLLKYKLAWEGKYYVEVDRWFASSKICSHCGEKKLMLTLNEREWVCSSCQTIHDRVIYVNLY